MKGRPEDIPSTSVPDGDRRQITVLFCDLVGSTEICSRLDPEEYQSVLLHYERICAEALHRFHGYLYQKQGDGVIAFFGYPMAAEDAAERAIRSGLRIIDSLSQRSISDIGFLEARVGISTGLVVISDPRSGNGSAVGNAMNLAARLQAIAAAGEVLVANNTKVLAGAYFEYVDRGARRLKGLSHPVQAWSVARTTSNDDRFEARLGRSLTPFVGRDKELDLLLQHWRASESGRGVAVLLSGEPGIGKSRLVLALRELVPTGSMLRLQSSPIFSNSAYYPFVTMLRDELAKRGSAQGLTQAELLSAIFHEGGPDAEMQLASLSSLLSPAGSPAPLATSSSFEQRSNAINGFIRLIAWLIEDQPALLIFEDAHWADPTTLEVLDRLVATLRPQKVLVIVTCRQELKRKWPQGCKFIRLRRLSPRSASRLALTVASGRLSSDILRDISAKAGGIPLFLEEVTKFAIEQPEERTSTTGKDAQIPGSLRDLLAARLDRLAAGRRIAQVASAFGREFAPEALSAVSGFTDARVERALRELSNAGLIYRRSSTAGPRFAFKHALIQEAAYDSLLKTDRQSLHRGIAEHLERHQFESDVITFEVLAHHYTEARLPAKAVQYCYLAGRRSLAQSANAEAIATLSRGLGLVEQIEDPAERSRAELTLSILKGNALMAVKGYTAPEVGELFDRARALCEMQGDATGQFPVLRGLWMFYLVGGWLDIVEDLTAQMLNVATASGVPAERLEAHRSAGITQYFLGNFGDAVTHLETCFGLYDEVQHRDHALLYGTDPGSACHCYVALCLCFLGSPHQAVERLRLGLDLAERHGHAFSKAFAYFFGSLVHLCRRDASAARELADVAIALSRKGGFALWLGIALVVRGWTREAQGDRGGVKEMLQGLQIFRASGAKIAYTFIMSALAEVFLQRRQYDRAREVVLESLQNVGPKTERVFHAELLRHQGLICLREAGERGFQGSRDALVEEGERHLLDAIAVARKQNARLFALRATNDLCRLLMGRGDRDRARRLLEGELQGLALDLDAAELNDAKTLLRSATPAKHWALRPAPA
ncbi:MAG: AAA family ATPase [Hyphomicrobiales bacterium]|nr:AAA family ATPase [Hyphomicrobiales bacterium]MBV9906505.1 AAA family ATPase [Hyphomicrobiales bacterium]